MRVSRRIVLVALGLTVPAAGQAQVTGLPVHNSGVSTGLSIGGEVGFPDADYGKGTAFGGRAAVGFGPLGLSALVSRWNPSGPGGSFTGYGGAANLKVFGGPLVPFSITLQGAVEYAKPGAVGVYHIPIGLGLALKIPNPALAIKPWIAPRIDLTRTSYAGSSNTNSNFGISGGVDFSLLGGLGFGAAYDRVFVGNGVNPSVLGVGVNYSIRVPGL